MEKHAIGSEPTTQPPTTPRRTTNVHLFLKNLKFTTNAGRVRYHPRFRTTSFLREFIFHGPEYAKSTRRQIGTVEIGLGWPLYVLTRIRNKKRLDNSRKPSAHSLSRETQQLSSLPFDCGWKQWSRVLSPETNIHLKLRVVCEPVFATSLLPPDIMFLSLISVHTFYNIDSRIQSYLESIAETDHSSSGPYPIL